MRRNPCRFSGRSTIAKRQSVRWGARHCDKARKSAIKQFHREYEFHNRIPDPPPDHIGSGRA